MRRNPWLSEILGSIPIFLALWLSGWVLDSPGTGFLCFLVVFTGRHLYQIYRLEKWLRRGGFTDSQPQSIGIWEEIYDHFYHIRRRSKNYKKQFSKILKRYRKATAALPDATVVLGPADEIDWFNTAAGPILGLQKGDRGLCIANLVRHPDFVRYLQDREYSGTVSIPAPGNEESTLQIRIVPYGGGLRLLMAQDVTRIRQMERMRTDFVANVSHELRTPLTVLRGYLETLQDADGIAPERVKKSLVQMEQQAKRMQFLIDDLLLLARLESGPLESRCEVVDVGAILNRICGEASALSDDQVKVDLRLETDAKLWGIEQELFSAFSNLVVNAMKHTPDNTPVTVRWRDACDGVRLDVIDRGEGIDSKHIPRLTERFYRVDVNRSRKEGGTGLGLAIVKHVLGRHDGELMIESTLGKGSCFSCCFPNTKVVRADSFEPDVIKMS